MLDDEERQEPIRKLPEFIIIDKNEKIEDLGSTPRSEYEEILGTIPEMTRVNQPFYLRFLAFFGTISFTCISLFILVLALIYFLLSLILFRQSTLINTQSTSTWNFFKRMIVFTLGCFVMIFNLSFGVGIILMYFMLRGEDMKSSVYHKFYENMRS